jgi:hypothetical protein
MRCGDNFIVPSSENSLLRKQTDSSARVTPLAEAGFKRFIQTLAFQLA